MSGVESGTLSGPKRLVERAGIPPALFWGFVGVLLFMIGDGVELGYLQPYLINHGFSQARPETLLTIYGISVAIGSWLSGALSERFSPQRVMMLGFAIWAVFEVLFLTFGLGPLNFQAMLITYFIRGFGYPLFAFGFLVWVSAASPEDQLGTAVGWFWFAFTGGLPTIASFFAGATIPAIGPYLTFWASLVLVVIGGIIALVGLREPTGRQPLAGEAENPLRDLFRGISITWRKPKVGIGGVVRIINTTPEYGFFAFLPYFLGTTIGFGQPQYLLLQGLIYGSNIIFNLIFGFVGDRIGWRRTVTYFGGLGCAITTIALYYVPVVTHNYALSVVVGVLYGATLAGFVPLSALMPSMVPDNDKGSSMAILNFGAGLAAFVGPAIVRTFRGSVGIAGVMWIFAILYLISAGMAYFLTDPSDPGEAGTTDRGAVAAADD